MTCLSPRSSVASGRLIALVMMALGAAASGCHGGEIATTGIEPPEGSTDGSTATSSGGGVVTLAAGQPAYSLAIDATRLYWTNDGTSQSSPDGGETYLGGQVMAVPLDGGAPVTLATNQDHPAYVAVDGTGVYWTNAGSTNSGGPAGAVMYVPLGGGSPTVLAAGRAYPGAIAVRDGVLYWLDTGTAALLRMPETGGTPQTLATARAFGISGIAVDATSVYWPDGNQGTGMGVFVTPLDGGTTTTLAPNANSPLGLAVDATTLYISLEIANPGGVMSVPLDGGAPTTLATPWATDYGIAIDDANVYWVVPGEPGATVGAKNGAIMSVPKGGGTPVTLATGAWSPFALVVDAANLYWTTREGYILKMAKP